MTAVAPVGLRDRATGTVTFTTSLGLGRKLERIARNPRVALAYHAREHGFADGSEFVLVQGDAQPATEPRSQLPGGDGEAPGDPVHGAAQGGKAVLGPVAARVLPGPHPGGGRRRAPDRLVRYWCAELRETLGAAAAGEPPRQTSRRMAPARASTRSVRRPACAPWTTFCWRTSAADGYPEVVPVQVEDAGPEGIRLTSERPLPPGGRRAGMLAHSYRPKLIGLAARQHTGWLTVGRGERLYAPHTESGFRAPANKTLLLANGLLAKRGLRRARTQAARAALALFAQEGWVSASRGERSDRTMPEPPAHQAEQPGAREYAGRSTPCTRSAATRLCWSGRRGGDAEPSASARESAAADRCHLLDLEDHRTREDRVVGTRAVR